MNGKQPWLWVGLGAMALLVVIAVAVVLILFPVIVRTAATRPTPSAVLSPATLAPTASLPPTKLPTVPPTQPPTAGVTPGAVPTSTGSAGFDMLTAGKADGYASAFSVPQGGSLDLHISSIVPSYGLRVTRAISDGWTLMTTISDQAGTYYPCAHVGVPAGQESVSLGCNWPVANHLSIPANWPSGLYAAQVMAAGDKPGSYGNYIPFVVTPARPAAVARILVQLPSNTWEAYNNAGGWSFYDMPAGSATPARRVTFDRPQAACQPDNGCWGSFDSLFVHWLDSQGLAVDYATDQDVSDHPDLLSHYALVIIPGHAEYWTAEMRDALDKFVSHGGNVAILSGNTAYRQVRYTDGGHTLVCYKDDWRQDPIYGSDNHLVATEFGRQPWPNWPEDTTIGLDWMGYLNHSAGDPMTGKYTVYHADSWVYAGTGLHAGSTFWFEPSKDTEVDGAPFILKGGEPVVTNTLGSDLTLLGVAASSQGHATLSLFTQRNGGTVFNAGATTWVRGLSATTNPQGYQMVQRITLNVINKLAGKGPSGSASATANPP